MIIDGPAHCEKKQQKQKKQKQEAGLKASATWKNEENRSARLRRRALRF
jgi:hypothetical protein